MFTIILYLEIRNKIYLQIQQFNGASVTQWVATENVSLIVIALADNVDYHRFRMREVKQGHNLGGQESKCLAHL